MENRPGAIVAAATAGLTEAGNVLRLAMERLDPSKKQAMHALFREGYYIEVVYSGIWGKDKHLRAMLVSPSGEVIEWFRVGIA